MTDRLTKLENWLKDKEYAQYMTIETKDLALMLEVIKAAKTVLHYPTNEAIGIEFLQEALRRFEEI